MVDRYRECKLVGRELEDIVAERLRALGLVVFQNAYVPKEPGSDCPYEVDLIAFAGTSVITIECKNYRASIGYNKNTGEWYWRGRNSTGVMHSPLEQTRSHARAINNWFHCGVFSAVVVAECTVCEGVEGQHIYRPSTLEQLVADAHNCSVLRPEVLSALNLYCDQWVNPSLETLQNHAMFLNHGRNWRVAEAIERKENVSKYCVCIERPDLPDYYYYYFYTDDEGVMYATEFQKKATFFDSLEDAQAIACCVPDGKVLSAEFGFWDYVHVPDEFEGMTPDEIAYELGARPW